MPAPDLYVKRLEFTDRRLGRHVVHDPRSRGFVRPRPVDKSTWRERVTVRTWDPIPNPNQPVGNCTMCAKGSQFNSAGNRVKGVVLGMEWALDRYVWETAHDQFPGAWKRDGTGQDTGSSGLWSAKTAQQFGEGGDYFWIMDGIDGVVQAVQDGDAVSMGTRWDNNMFNKNSQGIIEPGGGMAGGHQWIARAVALDRGLLGGRCWWGPDFRDWWIKLEHAAELLADDGDAHVQQRAGA